MLVLNATNFKRMEGGFLSLRFYSMRYWCLTQISAGKRIAVTIHPHQRNQVVCFRTSPSWSTLQLRFATFRLKSVANNTGLEALIAERWRDKNCMREATDGGINSSTPCVPPATFLDASLPIWCSLSHIIFICHQLLVEMPSHQHSCEHASC